MASPAKYDHNAVVITFCNGVVVVLVVDEEEEDGISLILRLVPSGWIVTAFISRNIVVVLGRCFEKEEEEENDRNEVQNFIESFTW